MKIAIVGTGIAGLAAAYVLSRAHDVVLFEADDHPGGHSNTVDVGSLPIDTGFIVHNRENYPLFTRLLADLGVATQPTVMSFSMECACGAAWSSRRPWRAGRLLPEIVRFLRTADGADVDGKSLQAFLDDEGYSESFRRHYLVPMTSALWSTPPGRALEVPAAFAIGFFRTHGMLGLRRHRWRTVVGGSRVYVRAALDRIAAPLHVGTRVKSVERRGTGVEVVAADGARHPFDATVIATSAPSALAMLASPTPREQRILGAFAVAENEVVLHRDARLLPSSRRDRSGWNYQSLVCGVTTDRATLTYSMTRLQSLETQDEWCVTLNRTGDVDPDTIACVLRYAHPQMTPASYEAQRELASLNDGVLAFAGAWQGFGFHEDGMRAGVTAAASLGVMWP
jgi:predicted NAD/FAD-binding protein